MKAPALFVNSMKSSTTSIFFQGATGQSSSTFSSCASLRFTEPFLPCLSRSRSCVCVLVHCRSCVCVPVLFPYFPRLCVVLAVSSVLHTRVHTSASCLTPVYGLLPSSAYLSSSRRAHIPRRKSLFLIHFPLYRPTGDIPVISRPIFFEYPALSADPRSIQCRHPLMAFPLSGSSLVRCTPRRVTNPRDTLNSVIGLTLSIPTCSSIGYYLR